MRERENEVVGDALRALRERAGLDQAEAAYRARLHRAQYGHYEQGRNAVSFVTMLYIAQALGATLEDIAAAVAGKLPERPVRDRA
jgi:transcriptional regulator with XRE-family HTH domain